MLYTDNLFLVCFLVVCIISRRLRQYPAWNEWFLIGFSLFLIATWGFFDLGLFVSVVVLNYWGSKQLIEESSKRSRAWLIALIVFNVSVLAFFKYANFFSDTVRAVSGVILPRSSLGIPLAISFYTFHIISYLVDVNAGRVRLVGFRPYLFYMAFFPHVIAGPIVRAWQLVPQLGRIRNVPTDFAIGFHFLVTGFFLKMVIANNIGRITDRFWYLVQEPTLSCGDHWSLAILYYCQIYSDFAGYSLIALGMARLLGFRLPVNFRSPMRASSLQEFWQRWHITLSKWLRDYVYFSIGGNRVSTIMWVRNIVVTMLLGGLWHGAGWNFVVWGGMHGVGIVTERLTGFTRWSKGSQMNWWISLVVTQLWILLTWVFFRAPDWAMASQFILHMVPGTGPEHVPNHAMIMAGLLLCIPVIMHNLSPLAIRRIPRALLGNVLGGVTGFLTLVNIVVFAPKAAFIYFRF